MKLLQKIRRAFGVDDSAEVFFKQFEHTARTRGCVCFFQEATETKTNGAGIVEKYAIEPKTTKLVLLPGDPYPLVSKKNLVAFEGLNRNFRRDLFKIRERAQKTQAA